MITRRATIASVAVLACSAVFPTLVLADQADDDRKPNGAAFDGGFLSGLSDEELLEFEELVAAEKRNRGMQSLPLASGTFTAGIDIDPGTYDIYVFAEDDPGHYVLDVTTHRKIEGESELEFDDWDLIDGGQTYRVSLNDGDQMKLTLGSEVTTCTISPAKKISFS